MKRSAVRALEGWLTREFGEPVRIESAERFGGVPAREIWKVAVTNAHEGKPRRLLRIVRGAALPGSEAGLSPTQEFAILCAAHESGVLVPRPLCLCEDAGVLGAPFFVTEFVPGAGRPELPAGYSGDGVGISPLPRASPGGFSGPPTDGSGRPGPDIAAQWGRELAKLHRITPQRALFRLLNEPQRAGHGSRIDRYRQRLDVIGDPQPVLEWVMRQLERKAPEGAGIVLCHGAAGSPSWVVDEGKLLAILDWQWSRWGDPYEDIGEVCAACRRHVRVRPDSAPDKAIHAFLTGYREHSPIDIEEEFVGYWEVLATLGRAVAALEQGHRFVAGGERAIEIALQSRRVAEMEIDLLAETDRLAMERAHA